ncbi:fibrobacter succinogenes major paralogous domain-containing protein [Fibrobacter sp.]|uniref:fibrobacter succinogenes major paralogous domain-containing protein n=1 Tax=Fibrobacter sp. TaxID=35828 RepID=UPI0038901320
MKKAFIFATMAIFAIFTACGDDSSSGPEEIESSSSEEKFSSSEEELSSSEEEEVSSSSDDIASSSGIVQSSSSEVPSSSSAAILSAEVKASGYYEENCPAGHTCIYAAPTTDLNSGITYGEILDEHDYQVYKVVTIGTGDNAQIWMAQNLNYDPGDVSDMGSYAWSGCYGDESSNCSKYGRLYTWEVAMNDADCAYEKTCNPSGTVQGICPDGWHLPSYGELETLINYIDPTFGYGHTGEVNSSTAGEYLKSKSGWNGSVNGNDNYGFSALPAGYLDNYDEFDEEGYYADFWSSSEDDSYNAYYLSLNYYDKNASLYWESKHSARSVRCFKNN